MNRLVILLASTLIPVVTLRAQSNIALSEPKRTSEAFSTEAAPRKTKATESPFYVKIYGFYGLLTPGTQINYSESLSGSGALYPFRTTNKGIGGGPRAGIGIGLILNDFINVGIDADILFSAPVKVDFGFSDSFAKTTTTSTTTLNVVSVIPNITFKALSRPTFYIYNRLGLVGGMVLDYKKVSSTVNLLNAGGTTTSGSTMNYTKNSLAIGYQAALGIQFRLSQAIRAFVEIAAYNQSFKPQRLEVTSMSTATGVTPAQVTEYTDEGVEAVTTKTQTGKAQSFTVPMNSIGVGAGLTFRF